jgi:hypothetical protein
LIFNGKQKLFFAHKTHFVAVNFQDRLIRKVPKCSAFSEQFKPPPLTTWWFDDWITQVYGERNTRQLPDVVVRDHPGRAGLRYAINWESAHKLPALIAEGRRTVRDAMVEAFVLEKW